MRQSAYLVNNPITVDNFAALLHVGGSGVRLYDDPDVKVFILVGWDWSSSVFCLVHRGSTGDIRLLQISSGVVWQSMSHSVSVKSSSLLLHSIKRELFVNSDNSLTGQRVMRTEQPTRCFVPLQKQRARLAP